MIHRELHALRGIACLLVLITHSFAFEYPGYSIGYGDMIAGTGKIGVWLFFVLSAFLLTLKLMQTGLGRTALIEYAVARCTRILLPFFFAVLFYSAFGTLGINSLQDAIEVASFRKAAGHLWTIPVEFTFYLVLPIILFLTVEVKSQFGRVALLLSVAIGSLIAWPPGLTPINALWVGWYMSTFIAGAVAAILSVASANTQMARLVGLVAALSVIAFTASAKLNVFGNAEMFLVDKHYLYGVLWSAVVYSVYVAPPALLNVSWLVKVGEWSYSAYLFHWAFGTWSTRYLEGPAAIVLAISASLVAGWLGYRLLEQPSQKLRAAVRRRFALVPHQ